MGSIKNAGIWAFNIPILAPGTAQGTIRCKDCIDMHVEPCTANERVAIASNGSKIVFNGKRFTNGEMWYRTLLGYWLFSLYVIVNDRNLPLV